MLPTFIISNLNDDLIAEKMLTVYTLTFFSSLQIGRATISQML